LACKKEQISLYIIFYLNNIMKHIGWCLDKIQIVMADIPREVISQQDKDKANKILDEVQEYADTLAKLVLNPRFKEYLNKLERSSIEGIMLQAHEIEELFKDLEHMLHLLDLYIKNLRDIILNHPEQWGGKADQLVLTIHQKFGGERGELRKVFQIAIHAREELEQIVDSEKHLAEFLEIR